MTWLNCATPARYNNRKEWHYVPRSPATFDPPVFVRMPKKLRKNLMTKITIASDSPCTLRVASCLPPSSVRYYCFSPRPLSEPCSRQTDKQRLRFEVTPTIWDFTNELFAGALRFLRLGTGKRGSSEPILGVISTTTEIKLYPLRGSLPGHNQRIREVHLDRSSGLP